MQYHQFEMSIAIPRDGRSTKIREYGSQGLTFVEGRQGQPYSVILRNNSSYKAMFVLSIDGVDVVEGKPATVNSRGYILEGYSATEIKGWRTSTSSIRQFYFSDRSGAYVAGTVGNTSNCGVVACKVFAESRPVVTFTPVTHISWPASPLPDFTYGASTASPMPPNPIVTCCAGAIGSIGPSGPAGINMVGAAPEFNLGTGWGTEMTDHITQAPFARGIELASMSVYYTDAASLQKLGIILDKEPALSLPQGFGGFCQPPNLGPR